MPRGERKQELVLIPRDRVKRIIRIPRPPDEYAVSSRCGMLKWDPANNGYRRTSTKNEQLLERWDEARRAANCYYHHPTSRWRLNNDDDVYEAKVAPRKRLGGSRATMRPRITLLRPTKSRGGRRKTTTRPRITLLRPAKTKSKRGRGRR